MSEPNYSPFLCELLESCPAAGDGVHPWLFKVARYLHRYHGPEEICTILEARVRACGRELEPHEIPDAVRNSGACKWEPSGKSASERRAEWLASPTITTRHVPEFKPELALETAARIPIAITPEWLKSRSPLPVDCSSEQFLESIFKPGERVVIFSRYKSQGLIWPDAVAIKAFSAIHWPDGAWFLCNPVDGQRHFNPRLGKQSQRSEESVTSFRYAVLECDKEPKETWFPIWLKILVGLRLPIVSITDSGGKSAHAVVRVSAESKQAWDKIKRDTLRPLVSLGADDGALSAVRLTRLPGCLRAERRQELLYLNPQADGTPIFQPGKSL
jgi:hypothetical protein